MLSRLVLLAVVGGITCASLVVFVFATGFQVRHAWYALVVTGVGAILTLALRLTLPRTDQAEETP
jgi:hypothetical protein